MRIEGDSTYNLKRYIRPDLRFKRDDAVEAFDPEKNCFEYLHIEDEERADEQNQLDTD